MQKEVGNLSAVNRKRTGLAVCVALVGAVSGCVQNVNPSAEVVGMRFANTAESPNDLVSWLERRGFEKLERHRFGGQWPNGGPCYEKARGGPLFGVDIVRVCYINDDSPVVFARQTHGRPWTEIYPTDMKGVELPDLAIWGISDAVLETMTL